MAVTHTYRPTFVSAGKIRTSRIRILRGMLLWRGIERRNISRGAHRQGAWAIVAIMRKRARARPAEVRRSTGVYSERYLSVSEDGW